MMSSSWFVLLLCLKTLTGMKIDFGEDDISVHEGEGSLQVVVTSRNLLTGVNISIQVMPMTLTQFTATGRPLPQGVSLADDPAEEGFDFDSSVHDLVIVLGMRETIIDVPIIDDEITEREEVFLLVLRVVEVHPQHRTSEVSLLRNVTIVHIQPSDRAVVSLRAGELAELAVGEGDGLVDDLLYVEVDREIEPDILVTLSIQKLAARDIEFPQTNIRIPSKTRRISVPFQITDDNISEFDQHVIVRLRKHDAYRSLYDMNLGHSKVDITIKDNDVPRIGFVVNGTAMDSMEMVEGENKEVCVSLLEPELTDAFFLIRIAILAQNRSIDVVSTSQEDLIILRSGLMTVCFHIQALDDVTVNSAHNVVLALRMLPFYQIRVDLGQLNVTVGDNDGVPVRPSDVDIILTGTELHVKWESHMTKFKPVERFIVIVQQSMGNSLSSALSRRQIDTQYHEYETNETSLTVKIVASESYFITVCALNRDWKVCSEPIQSQAKNLNRPTPSGLNGTGSEPNRLGTVSIVALIAGPAVALLLSVLLILIVIMCKCWGERGQYYPSRQDKYVIGAPGNVEAKMHYRHSSCSTSLSTEWTLTSPSGYFTELPKEPKTQSHIILGTPV